MTVDDGDALSYDDKSCSYLQSCNTPFSTTDPWPTKPALTLIWVNLGGFSSLDLHQRTEAREMVE